ncbi:rhomboid family intramembrane serine protease [Labilibaculum euxinus]|uniref:Rhomboid family intramembrane serine protease n=1 Tax=Labilibaculum euxinus TaxID=2686357 RepID=A0A7M4D0Q3_9BACT|nr:rhomboid family intramembrane serine protease [Labilibaculum euxinus]MUP36232.1 rhomboid family intramembrane serine protease [Labilibaculum euxinus]MVB05437.1 rhomboid family intramembrane serine protease [Labilibaculum euxinus]
MTIIIIAITVLISVAAFKKVELLYKYQFNAYQILKRNQWYRILTYGFLHANWDHLLVNMVVLFFFGRVLETYFNYYFGASAVLYFILLYVGAIVFSTLYDLKKHREHYHYNAVGASGAISAVVFAAIFFAPLENIYFMFFIPIPGIIFALGYLYYSYYMSKKNLDNIGHSAHFYGALFGFLFPILIKPQLFSLFLQQILNF